MAKPLHAEHRIHMGKPYPATVELCRRCRRGIIVYKGYGTSYVRTAEQPNPECPICNENEPGELYTLKVHDIP